MKSVEAPSWLQKSISPRDNRAEPRWIDPRTALVRMRDREHLSKVRDISPAGVSLSVLDAYPRHGEEVQVDISFEQQVVPFAGHVVHSVSSSWGSVVGVAFAAAHNASWQFLRQRYGIDG